MFHLFKRAYLEFDYKLDTIGYKFIMASSAFESLPMGAHLSDVCLLPLSQDFETMLSTHFENDVDKFWLYMYEKDHKVIAYFDERVVEKLLIQFIKSIFQYSNEQSTYLLYKSIVESVRVRSRIQTTAPDQRSFLIRKTFKIKSFDDFKLIYDAQPVSNFLRNVINKSDISFEYLLPDYFCNGNSSLYKDEVLARVRLISIDNWRDEIEQLKLETIFGFLDMDQVDSNLQMSIGNIEEQLIQSNMLKWMVDDNFSADPQYIKDNYNYLDFVEQWRRVYEIWGGTEDMREVNDLIMAENWELLLERDIQRNFGCLYTFELFREKSNQVFATFCYRMKRQNNLDALAPFKL